MFSPLTLTPSRARWLGIWAPAVFAVLAESVRETILTMMLAPLWVSAAAVVVTFLLAWAFSHALFRGLTASFREKERLRGELSRLLTQEKKAKALTDTLYTISRDLTSITDLERNLPVALKRVQTLVGSDMAALVLQDDDAGGLALKTWLHCDSCSRTDCPLIPFLAQSAVVSGSTQVYPPPDGATALTDPPVSCQISAAAVPIRVMGAWFGALVAGFHQPHQVADEEVAFLARVADGAAVAFENARLFATAESVAVLRERQRLARELHDSLAQSIALIRGRLKDVVDACMDGDDAGARKGLSLVTTYAERAERDVREAIWELKGSSTAAGDFLSALKEQLDEFGRHTHMAVQLEAPLKWHPKLPLHIEVQLVRIMQEALANVRKHARATRVRVVLSEDDSGLILTVVDNGRGFDRATVASRNRYGLQTMQERAGTFGGILNIDSRRGHGTRITVGVPVEQLTGARREGGFRAHSAS